MSLAEQFQNEEANDQVTEQATSTDTESTNVETQSGTDPETGQPVEIDSLDRYRYQGRPLKEWESGYMRQQDYTQKTQALAQERKYADNLSIDLERVRENPALAEQFKSVYPEKYHSFLRYISENSRQSGQQQGQPQNGYQAQQYAKLDPQTQMRIDQLEKNIKDKEVAAISADLDNKFATYQKKYPFADEETVIARAQSLLAKLKEQDPMNPDLRISDKHWDLLWKSVNDKVYALSDSQYKQKVQSQINANKKGADVGVGGGLPGAAPRQFKTIKEATNAFLSDIENGSV